MPQLRYYDGNGRLQSCQLSCLQSVRPCMLSSGLTAYMACCVSARIKKSQVLHKWRANKNKYVWCRLCLSDSFLDSFFCIPLYHLYGPWPSKKTRTGTHLFLIMGLWSHGRIGNACFGHQVTAGSSIPTAVQPRTALQYMKHATYTSLV